MVMFTYHNNSRKPNTTLNINEDLTCNQKNTRFD